MSSRRRSVTACAVAAGLVVALAGCSAATPVRTSTSARTRTPAQTGPERLTGVHVRVLQYRSDIAPHRVQLQVVNTSGRTVLLTAASLLRAGYLPAPRWDDTDAAEIPPGATVDLPAALGRASCAAAVAIEARLVLRDGRTATVPAADVQGTLATLRTADCFQQRADAVLAVAFTGLHPVAGTRTAHLDLDLRAGQDAAHGLTVTHVLPTTLLSPASGDELWQVDRRFTRTTRVSITATPTRCDLHAIAEDKVGSVLSVAVRLADGRSGTVRAVASSALRGRVLAWVARTCAPR